MVMRGLDSISAGGELWWGEVVATLCEVVGGSSDGDCMVPALVAVWTGLEKGCVWS